MNKEIGKKMNEEIDKKMSKEAAAATKAGMVAVVELFSFYYNMERRGLSRCALAHKDDTFCRISYWTNLDGENPDSYWEEELLSNADATCYMVRGTFDPTNEKTKYQFLMSPKEFETYLGLRADFEVPNHGIEG